MSARNGGRPCGACKFLRRKCISVVYLHHILTQTKGSLTLLSCIQGFDVNNVSKLLIYKRRGNNKFKTQKKRSKLQFLFEIIFLFIHMKDLPIQEEEGKTQQSVKKKNYRVGDQRRARGTFQSERTGYFLFCFLIFFLTDVHFLMSINFFFIILVST